METLLLKIQAQLELNFEESGTFDIEADRRFTTNSADTLNIAEAHYYPIMILHRHGFSTWGNNNENIIGDVQFINNSIDGDRFLWFWDGTQSDEYEPFHEYNINRAISVLLTAYNDNGGAFTCVDDTPTEHRAWMDSTFVPTLSRNMEKKVSRYLNRWGIGIAEYEISVYSPIPSLKRHSNRSGGFSTRRAGTAPGRGQVSRLPPQGSWHTWMAVMIAFEREEAKRRDRLLCSVAR